MIKILTGWGGPGGSTVAHINLVNALNAIGVESKLYSNQDWHSLKCSSGKLSELIVDSEDILIFHFLNIPENLSAKKIILSVHEQNLFNLSAVNLKNVDCIHMVSEHQAKYHNIDSFNKPYFILSNIFDDLKPNPKTKKKSVGIVGSVDENKQVDVSILRAIGKGFKDITIFGNVTDQKYYQTKVLPLIQKYHVKGPKFSENKQEMYDSITDVFFSSKLECLPYVIGECKLTGTNIHLISNKNYTNGYYETDKSKILNKWKEVFEI
jgi:hypothetical protein